MRKKEKEHRRLALEFLCMPDHRGLNDLHVLRAAVNPYILLMHKLLKDNEPAADLEVMRSLQGQSQSIPYRLCKMWHWSASREGACQQAMRKSFELLSSGQWQDLPKTNAQQAFIVQMVLRPCAVLYELVVVKHRGFPHRLFSLLLVEGLEETIVAEAQAFPCLLDEFSEAFLARYPDAASLRTLEARCVLSMIALQAMNNTHGTERLHSSNARRARSRTHTHVIKLHDVAMFHQGRAAPRWFPRPQEARAPA